MNCGFVGHFFQGDSYQPGLALRTKCSNCPPPHRGSSGHGEAGSEPQLCVQTSKVTECLKSRQTFDKRPNSVMHETAQLPNCIQLLMVFDRKQNAFHMSVYYMNVCVCVYAVLYVFLYMQMPYKLTTDEKGLGKKR